MRIPLLLRLPLVALGGALYLGLILLIARAVTSGTGAAGVVLIGGLAGLALLRLAKVKAERPARPPIAERLAPTRAATAPVTGQVRDLVLTKPTGLRFGLFLGMVAGAARWLDLRKAPHVLVGGSTGSGKSQWLRTALTLATASNSTGNLRVVLIDPKRVELAPFKHLPHVAAHVTEPEEARETLEGLAAEMDARYATMEACGVVDVLSLPDEERKPAVLVVVDEFADLVLTTRRTPHEVEPVLARLLALGRAAGIHVLLATQRPDAKVVTGLIKANCPTRIAFQVSSAVNSRIILDARGAEALRNPGEGLTVCAQVSNEAKPGEPVPFKAVMLNEAELDLYLCANTSAAGTSRTASGRSPETAVGATRT